MSENNLLIKTLILSSAPSGYRRAGLGLNKGENHADVTSKQYEMLGNDPRLSVQKINDPAPGANSNSLRQLDENSVDPMSIGLNNAPEDIAHFIGAIQMLAVESPLSKKPNCDELEVQVEPDDGEAFTVTPTSKQRDTAWSWYQKNIVKTQTNEE